MAVNDDTVNKELREYVDKYNVNSDGSYNIDPDKLDQIFKKPIPLDTLPSLVKQSWATENAFSHLTQDELRSILFSITGYINKKENEKTEKEKRAENFPDRISQPISSAGGTFSNRRQNLLKISSQVQSQNSNGKKSASIFKQMSRVGKIEIDDLLGHYSLRHEIVKCRDQFLGKFNLFKDYSKIKKPELTDNIEKAQELDNYNSRIEEINQWIEDYRYHVENVNTLQDNNFKPYKLFVPLSDYSVNGKSDAIIRTNVKSSMEIGPHVVALIDFKTEDTVNQGTNQGIFELIGASFQSEYPVLYVQTDMRDFYFIRISESLVGGRFNIIQYRVKTQHQAFEILDNWINLSQIMLYEDYQTTTTATTKAKKNKTRISEMREEYQKILKHVNTMKSVLNLPKGVNEECASLLKATTIQEAYTQHKEEICNTSRTGEVYKIKINDSNYVIKIPAHNSLNQHIKLEQLKRELENEASIYKRLSYLEQKLDISEDDKAWPSLFYAGALTLDDRKIDFAIVTSFIDGKNVKFRTLKSPKIWENADKTQREACLDALTRLNLLGIQHMDARIPNFKITGNRAIILDFGLSELRESSFIQEELKDDWKDCTDNISSLQSDLNNLEIA